MKSICDLITLEIDASLQNDLLLDYFEKFFQILNSRHTSTNIHIIKTLHYCSKKLLE